MAVIGCSFGGGWSMAAGTRHRPAAGQRVDYLPGKRHGAPRVASVRGVTSLRTRSAVGELLRDWRLRRRLSQLDLAARRRRLPSAPQLPRDRAGPPEPRDGPAPGRAARGPAARAQRPAAGGRVRPGLRTARRSTTPTCPPSAAALELVLAATSRTRRGGRPAVAARGGNRERRPADRGVAESCSLRRPTCCDSACIPTGWRRASSTSRSGAGTCSHRLDREAHAHRRRPAARRCTASSPRCPAAPIATPPDGIAVPLRVRAGDDVLTFLST